MIVAELRHSHARTLIAHIRHTETEYDTLLARGSERRAARAQVEEKIDRVLARWQVLEY